jgi:outer membrane protein assembly factor BamE (lipoprotein component of BamABCDE complex)
MPDNDKIAELKKGQTKMQVESLLGSPSAVSTLDNDKWIYMSSTLKKVAFFTPKIVDRDILTVEFDKSGNVVSFSRLNEQNGQELAIDEDKTESGGHNIGFFKKYFGGVGSYMPIGPTKEK